MHYKNKLISVLILLIFSGCVTKPVTLYQWEGYQGNLDAYFNGDQLALAAQAQLMEADLIKIKAHGGVVPPGFRAHLGLIYAQQGYMDKFATYLEEEKIRFPESERFIEFLTRHKIKEVPQ